MITIGAVVAAFAIEEFLAPCTILDASDISAFVTISDVSEIIGAHVKKIEEL